MISKKMIFPLLFGILSTTGSLAFDQMNISKIRSGNVLKKNKAQVKNVQNIQNEKKLSAKKVSEFSKTNFANPVKLANDELAK